MDGDILIFIPLYEQLKNLRILVYPKMYLKSCGNSNFPCYSKVHHGTIDYPLFESFVISSQFKIILKNYSTLDSSLSRKIVDWIFSRPSFLFLSTFRWDVLDWKVRYGGPASKFTGLEGSNANILVADTRLYLHWFICLCWRVRYLWQHKRNLNNIRQEFFIFYGWLVRQHNPSIQILKSLIF